MNAIALQDSISKVDCPSEVVEYHGLSDARLVECSRRGCHGAFGELVKRYEQRLRRTIGRFVTDRDTTEDLVQDAFLKAFQNLKQFDPSRRFGPWLFRIGVNLALDHLRKLKRRGWVHFFSENPDAATAVGPSVDDPRTARDLQQEVRLVIEMLPATYRTVIVLRDLENFSVSEIAVMLDRKESTIRWRLSEARSRFETLWKARQAELDAVCA